MIAVPVVLWACGGGGGGGPTPPPPPPPDGTGVVGPSGGTVTRGTNAGVTVPAGALSSEITITIDATAIPADLRAAGAIGQAFRFTPGGQQFSSAVDVFIFLSTADLGGNDINSIRLISTGPGGVEELTNIRRQSTAGGFNIRGNITHFSTISAAIQQNRPPTASAGANQTVTVPATVQLQGTGSDPDGDPVTFAWSLPTRPAGSMATLSSTNTAATSFMADVAGAYVAQLTVSDNQGASSNATVTITGTAPANIPVANAGPDQVVDIGSTVQLDGSNSSDPENDPLTFMWRLVETPGDSPMITNADQAMASFLPTMTGRYVAELEVSDGTNTDTDQVVIIVNTPPVITFGPDALTIVDDIAQIIFMTSDADGDQVMTTFEIVSAPTGSVATIMVRTNSIELRPDLPGTYRITGTADDGRTQSTASTKVDAVPDVDGTYDASLNLDMAQGCGDVPAITADGELEIDQRLNEVTLKISELDPSVLDDAVGTIGPTGAFNFQGPIRLRIDASTVVSVAFTITGTFLNGEMDLNVSISILSCTISGKLTGTIQQP